MVELVACCHGSPRRGAIGVFFFSGIPAISSPVIIFPMIMDWEGGGFYMYLHLSACWGLLRMNFRLGNNRVKLKTDCFWGKW